VTDRQCPQDGPRFHTQCYLKEVSIASVEDNLDVSVDICEFFSAPIYFSKLIVSTQQKHSLSPHVPVPSYHSPRNPLFAISNEGRSGAVFPEGGGGVCIGSSDDCMTKRGEEEEELEDLEVSDVTIWVEDDGLLIEALGRRQVIFLSYVTWRIHISRRNLRPFGLIARLRDGSLRARSNLL